MTAYCSAAEASACSTILPAGLTSHALPSWTTARGVLHSVTWITRVSGRLRLIRSSWT
jgi:hypothetical protein